MSPMNNTGDYKSFGDRSSDDGRTTNHRPLVSIITPSFNQAKFLERTIRSVLAQDYPNIEYIVIDGMSTDKTPQVLQKYEQSITRIIREPDEGQADAIDKGFKLASGDILTWINSDDCYCSSSVVSKAVATLADHPTYDLVYGRRKYVDENGYLVLVRPFREFSHEALKLSCYLPQECCFWTREIYERAGGFVDASYNFAMDYELWMRLLENGAKFLAIKDFFGLYRLHENAKSVAQWETVGLKEIPRVYERYCDKVLSPGEMYDAYVDYFAGFNRFRNPRLERTRELITSALEKVQAASNGLGPLDNWTFRRDAQLFKFRSKQKHVASEQNKDVTPARA